MKRGLKGGLHGVADAAGVPLVATYAPMKRGLKVTIVLLALMNAGIKSVATYAPMKRGLKVTSSD